MPEPMRVGQVIQRPQRRGAELFAARLGKELVRRGSDVHTLYLYQGRGESPPVGPNPTYLAADETHPLERVLGLNPSVVLGVRRWIARVRPHIVQANAASTVKYVSSVKRLFPGDWRLVYRNIGNPQDWLHAPAKRLVYQRVFMPVVDGIVAIGSPMDRILRELYGPSIRMTVIPNGVDPGPLVEARLSRAAARAAYGVVDGTPVLICVGSLSPEKRVDLFLDTLRGVRRRHTAVRGWIVGDGPLRSALEAQARDDGQADAVTFWGERSDVPSLMAAADVLVLPSDTEGMPAVVLEAAFCGLPVVCSDVGALSDCVRSGETGFLAPRGHAEPFVRIVSALLSDATTRRRLAEGARRWVGERFTIPVVARRYLEFYQRTLSSPAAAPPLQTR